MPKITELYAWVLADTGPEDEGIPAVEGSIGRTPMVMPLMGADMERAKSLQVHAQAVANKAGKPLKLVRCSQLEVIKWVQPKIAKENE